MQPIDVDDELVIRPKRELRILPTLSEQAMAIGVIAVIAVLLLVILVVTW